MIEGGGETNAAFLNEGLVDELRIAVAPTIIGGRNSPTFADGPDVCSPTDLELIDCTQLGEMVILRYRFRQAEPPTEVQSD